MKHFVNRMQYLFIAQFSYIISTYLTDFADSSLRHSGVLINFSILSSLTVFYVHTYIYASMG